MIPGTSTSVDASFDAAHARIRTVDELVRVFATASAMEGQLVKGRLEAEGIPVLLKGEAEGPYRMGPAEVFVPSSFEPQARLVLESIADGEASAEDEDEASGDDQPAGADTP
jgi:putative signal transducing protein